MNAALWGLAAALAFGIADFCGRFTSRALGPASATLGLMLAGALAFAPGHAGLAAPPWDWRLLLAGTAAMVAPLALYRAMTLGPLSLVMPITAAYPALVMPVALVLGTVPSSGQWLGMAVTGAGALVVARTAHAPAGEGGENRPAAIAHAGLACLLFAVALLAGGAAVARFGAGPTLWLGRVLGAILLLTAFAATRRRPRLPPRWWPLLALQGLLDAGAYFCFYRGAEIGDGTIAAATSSAFMVVGVVLGWLILREPMRLACWAGVLAVFGGVVLLSAAA